MKVNLPHLAKEYHGRWTFCESHVMAAIPRVCVPFSGLEQSEQWQRLEARRGIPKLLEDKLVTLETVGCVVVLRFSSVTNLSY